MDTPLTASTMGLRHLGAGLLVVLGATVASAQERPTLPDQVTSIATVYDVADLTGHDRVALRADTTPTKTRRAAPATHPPMPSDASPSTMADAAAQELVELIETWISPPLGGPSLGQIVDWTAGGQLMVIGWPAHHEWIQAFLDTQRQHPEPIELRARLLSLPLERLAAAGLTAGGEARVLGSAEVRALMAGLLTDGGEEIAAPTLATFPRQRGTVSILDEQSYVVGWNLVEVMPGPTLLADPLVDTVAEGSVLAVTATPLSDGTYGLDVDLSISRLNRPVRTTETELHPSLPPVTFSLPEVTVADVWARAALVPQAAMCFASEGPDGDAIVAVIELDRADGPDGPR